MKKLLLFAFVFNLCFFVEAQAQSQKPSQILSGSKAPAGRSLSDATQTLSGGVQEAWVARYDEPGHANDFATAMVIDGTGNIYVTGSSGTVKYNSAGIQQWVAKGSGDALAVDGAGNVYVTGSNRAIKYNPAGTQEWVATYNGPINYYYPVALALDGAGNVYVTGKGDSCDYATIKYNSAGAQEWVQTVGVGGNADDPVALGIDAAGNVYVTGTRGYDYYTVKYNSAGARKWTAKYNGFKNGHDYARALAVDGTGNVYVTGFSWNGASYDYATVKYNSSGNRKWVATYNGPVNYWDRARALAVDGAGNVYVTGDYATVKYNAAGKQEWVATYQGSPVALGIDAAGNVYVTGSSGTVKYNSTGTQEWVKTYQGSPVALGIDAADNIYVTGSRAGAGTSSDYATVKYDAFGVEQWVARHDAPAPSSDIATAMVVDDLGNIYVTGYKEDLGYGSVTLKYAPSGVRQWVARAPDKELRAVAVDDAGNVYVTGSSNTYKYNSAGKQEWVVNRWGKAIAVDGAGNVYVTGRSGSSGYFDYATSKYNSAGQEQWVARYNGPRNGSDYPVALALDGAGNIYVTGVSSNGTNKDYATIKYNPAGVQQWVARYNGPGNGHDDAAALDLDGAGNVYVTGVSSNGTNNDYATVKYNSAGTQEWVATYNGPENGNDYAVAFAVDDEGNVYVTGYSSWNADNDFVNNDYVTVKYNSAGTQEWVATYNGPRNYSDRPTVLGLDAAGNVYVTGSSLGIGTSYDYATVKYNSAGTLKWAKIYNGPGNSDDYARALGLDAADNVYVTGLSYGSGTGYDFATIKYTQTLSPIANAGPDKTICAGGSVQIGGSPTGAGGSGGPYTFSWSPAAGLDNPTAANPNTSPATTTTYTVTVTETATGDFATDDVTVTPQGGTGWSVAHIVDVDDVIFGINQDAAPRDNRGLALSPDEQYLYLSYNNPVNQRLVRKIKLSESLTSVADPANNHAAVVAQLDLGSGAPANALATDDKGRVYLARPQKIWIYKPDLSAALLHSIDGFTNCEGVAVTRESGKLVVYVTDRTTKLLKRFELTCALPL